MKLVIVVVYVVMAIWLLAAAAIRISLQLGAGLPLDWLPFVSGGLGLLGLLALLPAGEELRQRDQQFGRGRR